MIRLMNRRQSAALSLLLLAALCALACGGGQSASHDDLPPLNPDNIRRDINGRFVRVPSADGKSEPIPWVFDPFEQKDIQIIDQKIEGETATFLINMKTHTMPRSRNPRSLSGQLRLHYRLQSGLVLRQWEIEEVENVSFTYTDEPRPSPTNETNTNAKPSDNANASNSNAKTDANANAKPAANRNSPARQ